MVASRKRILFLDVLRVFAVSIVVLNHYGSPFGGVFGVALFFAISGFCITQSAFHVKKIYNFIALRITRILPALIACGLITVAFEVLLAPSTNYDRTTNSFDTLLNFICLPNGNILCDVGSTLLLGHYYSYNWIDGVYWSLLVEIRFYILFALFYYVLSMRRYLAAAFLALAWLATLDLSSIEVFSKQTDLLHHFVFFAIGIATAMFESNRKMVKSIWCVCFGSILFFGFLNVGSFSYRINSENSLIFCLIVAPIILTPLMKMESGPVWQRLGALTYPVYLLHQDIGLLIDHHWIGHPATLNDLGNFSLITTKLFLVIFLSVIVNKFVERPIQKNKKRILQLFSLYKSD